MASRQRALGIASLVVAFGAAAIAAAPGTHVRDVQVDTAMVIPFKPPNIEVDKIAVRQVAVYPTTTTTEAPAAAHISPPKASRSAPVEEAPPEPVQPAKVQAAAVDVDGMPRTLRRIGGCESSGAGPNGEINWTDQNPSSTASGGFQDLDSTWRTWAATFRDSVIQDHGDDPTQYRRAMYAPPEIQLAVNLHAYLEYGTSPWNSSKYCWAG